MSPEQQASLSKPERVSSKEERTTLVVSPEHIDGNKHVNYLAFQNWMAGIHYQFMVKRGISHETLLNEYGICLFIRKVTAEYEKELAAYELAECATMATVGNTSIVFDQAVYNLKKELAGKIQFTLVAVKEGKAVPLPEKVKEALLSEPQST